MQANTDTQTNTHAQTHTYTTKTYIVHNYSQCVIVITVQWKPVEIATVLKLLQPVEGYWKKLAGLLLREELQCEIKTIESDCFHDDSTENALDETLTKWLSSTPMAKQSWQTLCNAAKKCGDKSLEIYIQEKNHKSKSQYVTTSIENICNTYLIQNR